MLREGSTDFIHRQQAMALSTVRTCLVLYFQGSIMVLSPGDPRPSAPDPTRLCG